MFKHPDICCVEKTHITCMYDFKFYKNIYDCSVIECLHMDEIFSRTLNCKRLIHVA